MYIIKYNIYILIFSEKLTSHFHGQHSGNVIENVNIGDGKRVYYIFFLFFFITLLSVMFYFKSDVYIVSFLNCILKINL